MLERLRAADVDQRVTTVLGDMVDDLPAGPFDLVFVAFNSLFMLDGAGTTSGVLRSRGKAARTDRCLRRRSVRAVGSSARRIARRRALDERGPCRARRHITDPVAQTVAGQFIELIDGQPVRLRPYVLRWSRPSELDDWADGRRAPACRALRRRRTRPVHRRIAVSRQRLPSDLIQPCPHSGI